MSRLLCLFLLVSSFSCEGQNAMISIVGTYELLEGTAVLPTYKHYDRYTIGKTDISYATGATGHMHYSWKGFYVRNDSLLDVLIYFSSTMDGNVGWRTASTVQKKLQLIVRENGGEVLIARKNSPAPLPLHGAIVRLNTLPHADFSIYSQKSDSVRFYPLEPAGCNGYTNSVLSAEIPKHWTKDPTYRAEKKVYKLLSEYLNTELEAVPASQNLPKLACVALLKMDVLTDFPLPEVTIICNSTPYSTERLIILMNKFLTKKLRAFRDTDLQDFLLVTIVVREEGVCVLLPQYGPFFLRMNGF